MTPLTFLYDEQIDWPKLSEQKKNPFEYIVPPPHKWGRNQNTVEARRIHSLLDCDVQLGGFIVITRKQGAQELSGSNNCNLVEALTHQKKPNRYKA